MTATFDTENGFKDFTTAFQESLEEAQAKLRTTIDKNVGLVGELGELTQGNLEALYESGKILLEGVKAIGKAYLEEGKSAFDTIRADAKDLGELKSVGAFLDAQSAIIRKYFDSAVAANSRQSEALVKLANDALQPISSRVSLAMDKFQQAA